MKFVAFASLLAVAALSFALAGTPAVTQADSHTSTCESCGKAPKSGCAHCAAGETCPHCDEGEACPDCDVRGRRVYRGSSSGHEWEYKCVRPSKKADAMTAQFNGLAAAGWKLKQADGGYWCFARMRSN
jgi:hypothetical protein